MPHGCTSLHSSRPLEPRRVAVVYHFFAHYREAVLRELVHSGRHSYTFWADERDFTGSVKAAKLGHLSEFNSARCIGLCGHLLWQRKVIRLAWKRDHDCIIFLGNARWPSTWVSAILARLRGKTVLFWTHGWTRPDLSLKGAFRKYFYRIAHGLLLYGHLAKCIGIDEGFDPQALHVIYNSLDVDAQKCARSDLDAAQMQSLKAQYFSEPDRPLLVCTSRLVAYRRLDLLLKAMNLLRERGRPVNLILIGDGPERSSLQLMAAEMQLSVVFYGACYQERTIGMFISAADIAVSPGAIGLTAMHSMGYGTPVITHDDLYAHGPEVESIVPGRNGDLFRNGNISSLAEKIEEWAGRKHKDSGVKDACYSAIDRFYNPRFQVTAIDRAVSRLPADDLFWMKQRTLPRMDQD